MHLSAGAIMSRTRGLSYLDVVRNYRRMKKRHWPPSLFGPSFQRSSSFTPLSLVLKADGSPKKPVTVSRNSNHKDIRARFHGMMRFAPAITDTLERALDHVLERGLNWSDLFCPRLADISLRLLRAWPNHPPVN